MLRRKKRRIVITRKGVLSALGYSLTNPNAESRRKALAKAVKR